MIHSLIRKRNALLTTAVLSALSLPAYAADADADPLQVKTDPIVVTASRTEQLLRESPASAEVITRKDIDRMGAENLVQALRLAVGIDVRENGMVGNQSAIRRHQHHPKDTKARQRECLDGLDNAAERRQHPCGTQEEGKVGTLVEL